MSEIRQIKGKEARKLQEDLERLSELADAAQEHAKLDKRVKEKMKEMGEGLYTAGDWRVTVESRPRTSYNIPDDVKAKFKIEETSTYVKWEKR